MMRTEIKERLERAMMRRALNMPASLSERIFGEAPVNDRGVALENQTHILLRLIELTNQPELADMSVEAARELYDSTTIAMDLAPVDLPTVEDRAIPGHGAGAKIPIRVYRPGPGTRPAIVFYHGGGFVLGSLDSYDGICSNWAAWTDCVVISVDYRLAPEHAFPAAVEDAISAYRWIAQNARLFDIDATRLALAGDSAGANLAAVVAHATAEDDLPPVLQVLVYPTTDHQPGYPSIELFSSGYFLTARNMIWFTELYMQGQEVADARIAPILLDDFGELPTCHITTAGFDPLRDEGEAYADRIEGAGVRVVRRHAHGLVHGFLTMGGIIGEAARICEEIAHDIARELHRIG